MRNLLLVAALAMGISGCSKPAAENAQENAVGRAKFIAAGMDAIAPKELGGGLVMSGASADGDTLIINFKGVDAAELSIPDFDDQAKRVVCADRNFRNVIDKGIELVLAFKAGSGASRSVRVTSC